MSQHLVLLSNPTFIPQFGRSLFLKTLDVALRLCHPRYRFKLAMLVARPIGHLLRRTSYYAERPPLRDGYREEALRLSYGRLVRRGLKFDPALKVNGPEPPVTGGAIILSCHFLLNVLYLRWLHDKGYLLSTVGNYGEQPTFAGTSTPLDVIKPSKTLFLQAMRRLREGRIVGAAVDFHKYFPGARPLEIDGQYLYLSDGLIKLAARANVPVMFLATRIGQDGRIETDIVKASGTCCEEVFNEFCQFLRSEIAKIAY